MTLSPTPASAANADERDASAPSSDVPRRRGAMDILRRIMRRPLAAASVVYIAVLVLASAAAPWLAPSRPAATDLRAILEGPSGDHWLGTDALGRDVLSRLMYGGRLSLVNALIAVITVLLLAVLGGVVAGFFGGWWDRCVTWLTDLVIAIPGFVVLVVLLAIFGNNTFIAMVALGVLMSPGLARIVRSVTLAERKELYIAGARASGLPEWLIVFKHVLPRIAGPIIVSASLLAGTALTIDASLAYLGFGAQPPTPTWGGMIAEASTVISRQPWLLVPSGTVLGLAILAFGLLGDAGRDANAERSVPAITRRRANVRRPAVETSASPPPSALLDVREVSITLNLRPGPTTVVEDLSLHVDEGETVGLVGESGCGKTLSARSVLGLLPAGGQLTSGSIWFEGREITTADPRAMRALRGSQIGMISQEPVASLDPVFAVGQQLRELVQRHHRLSSKEASARVLELLESVRFDDPARVAKSYPHELSGGMAQRVGIALALAGEPKLVIADEPTTALDVTTQAEILKLLRELQEARGMAILLVSHNWGVIAEMCDRAYVMYAGHVVESCRVVDMFEQPMHPYTAGLLAATPRRATPRHHLTTIPGTVPSPGTWPHGCHFAPRCGFATEECVQAPVPVLEPRPGHRTRCIHHEELRTSDG